MGTVESPVRAYLPALDGLRTVSVVAVLLFHGGVRHLAGGFLGVDCFFVLSGFLITGVLVREYDDFGRIDLRRFYGARLRRLLPALLAVLVAVVVATRLGALPRRDGLAGDAHRCIQTKAL